MKMQNVQKGFTLIELMIVIAIVGILAAIALPAYQDYTVRAKMSEPMAALAEAKTTLSEYYVTNSGVFPATATLAGISTNPDKSIVVSLKYEQVASDEAVVTATVRQGVIPNSTDSLLGFSLSSITKSDGSIQWTCKRSTVASGATALSEEQAKYLPSNCRS